MGFDNITLHKSVVIVVKLTFDSVPIFSCWILLQVWD